jgi:protein-disulfide isomerase
MGAAICAAVLTAGAVGGFAAQSPAKKTSSAKTTTTAAKKAPAKTTAAAPAPKTIAPGDLTARKSLGTKNAPINMQVFSDFQCPACRELYISVVRQVIDNYVSAGKVYLIHRDMPLPIHQHSREAARYANAAAMINRLEKVVGALFEKQATWAVDGNVDGVVAAVLSPSEIKQVRALVNSTALDAAIDTDYALGKTKRVDQTPTTIITYKGTEYPVVGVVSYRMMKDFLDGLLRQ